MKTKHKLLIAVFATALSISLAHGIAACNDGHEHVYGDWDADENYHWQYCLDCGFSDGRRYHSFEDGICSICDYRCSSIEVGNLSYTLNADQQSYTVAHICNIPEGKNAVDIVIESTVCGLPVTSITGGNDCFYSLRSITIPDSIVSVESEAFKGCDTLFSVIFMGASRLTSIEASVFSGCTSLTEINLPESITYIGADAFSGTGLKNFVISDSITDIGAAAFANCTSLKSITIPNSIVSIELGMFLNCTSLTEIVLPDSITSIGESAFKDCKNLTEIVLSDNITSIGENAFEGSGLERITIPDSITVIPQYLFSRCSNLFEIKLPESLTAIGDFAFSGCSRLISFSVPKGLISIGYGAFNRCNRLVEIYNCSELEIKAGGLDYSPKTGDIGDYALNVYTPSKGKSKLETVDDFVFFRGNDNYKTGDCIFLMDYRGSDTELVLPKYYRSGGVYNVYNIYRGALQSCENVESVSFPYSEFSPNSSQSERAQTLAQVFNTTEFATYVPETLKTVILRGGEAIPQYAFYNCTNIESLLLPNTLIYIGLHAFEGCDNLIYNEYENGLYLGNDDDLYLALIAGRNRDITSLMINRNTAIVADEAMKGYENLEVVSIGESTNYIGREAFADCVNLTTVYWNARCYLDVTVSIVREQMIFSSCTALETVIIGDEVFSLPRGVFAYSGLRSVIFGENITSIPEYAFYYTELESIVFGENIESISKYAFYHTALENITVYGKLTSIEEYAFGACYYLQTISYTDSQQQWDAIAKGKNWIDPNSSYQLIVNTEVQMPDLRYELKYEMNADGKSYTVVGIEEYKAYKDVYDEIIVPDLHENKPVTAIGEKAFQFVKVKNVSLGTNIISIGTSAFYRCGYLQDITIPAAVKTIGDGAFDSCTKVTNLTFESNKTLTEIGAYAFWGCSFATVSLPDSLTTIGEDAFAYCDLTEIQIPAKVEVIPTRAFVRCEKLVNVTFADGIKLREIGVHAFWLCTSLQSIVLPSGLETIGNGAFSCCESLTSITIPNSVTSIGMGAFYKCSELTINFTGTRSEWDRIEKPYWIVGLSYYTINYLGEEKIS